MQKVYSSIFFSSSKIQDAQLKQVVKEAMPFFNLQNFFWRQMVSDYCYLNFHSFDMM